MAANRIFRRFAELLDIKVSRAAAAWLRLNTDGSVSERTAAETLMDLGAGATGISLLGAASEADVRSARFGSDPTFGTPTCPTGWTNNGDGSFTAATSSQVTMTIPLSGMEDNAVYLCKFTIASRTQGNVTFFISGLSLNAIPVPSANTQYTGTHAGLLVISGSAQNQINIRSETSGAGYFVGTISDIQIIRIA